MSTAYKTRTVELPILTVEYPVRDLDSAYKLVVAQLYFALNRLTEREPELAAVLREQGEPSLRIAVKRNDRGVLASAVVTGSPQAFHDALQSAYGSMDGDAEYGRRCCAMLLPIRFVSGSVEDDDD